MSDNQERPEINLVHNRTGYIRGCRCSACVQDNREYQRKYMKEWRSKKKAKPDVDTPVAASV
jgi:hypothetical protein